MWYSDSWKDYELIDTSKGMRLERWGKYILVRPDPQVIWTSDKKYPEWRRADAEYERRGGGGSWKENKLPAEWRISYKGLTFTIAPGGFNPGLTDDPDKQAFQQTYIENCPLGCWANEDDIKGPVAFLASDASGYITGATLVMDGGWTIW